jgi:hypothetical protein
MVIVKVLRPTAHELEIRLDKIVGELNVKLPDLRRRAAAGDLQGPEWAAWEEVESILFLLGDER